MCTDWQECKRRKNGSRPCSPSTEPHWSRSLHLTHWGMLCWEQEDTPQRKLHFCGDSKQAQMPGRHLQPLRGPTPNQSVSEGLYPMKVTHTGTVLRTAVHWKQIIWAVYKQLYHPMEGTLHWSEQGNSAGRKEQWQVWWTDLEPPIPYHPAPFMAEEEE